MKRTILTLLAAALLAGTAAADRFATSKGSFVRIEGTSTLHAWKMEGPIIRGQLDATAPDRWTGAPKAVITIPVTSIRSEHSKMDKLMADALSASKHPEIRYELIDAKPASVAADVFTMDTRGKLTIAGVTREIAMQIRGTRTPDGRYTLTGEAPIRMTSFGIQPPKAMLNTIRTGDDVKVTFRWVVESTGTQTGGMR